MAAAWCVIVDENVDEIIERRNGNEMRVMRKILRDTQDPFDIPEGRFQELYRLSKEAAMQLCISLTPYMPQGRKSTAIPSELKILATLSFLASGSYQRRISQDFLSCMYQSSLSGAIHTVIEALNQIMQYWIKFPREHLVIELIKQQFWIHCRFPGVIGAIDGTHVAIWPPNKEREHLYINRKLYHSLNVLIVSDFNGKILFVNSGHGERNHDARVWNASILSRHLERQFQNGRTNAWLLGDSGYPLLPYLLTPKLRQPDGSPSARYTNAHVRARSCIERAIGMLKGRWRCLRKERALHYSPEFSALIVNACCVVQNIAKFYNIPEPEVYYDELDVLERNMGLNDIRNNVNGNEIRERVIQQYFN
ncbi:putative nuclease HARBI1 [Temnothorax nylanderi]|uniref:putative nuclease HARBI1 n=1 Tax=Temnothorax nylanderi TaxID=102681 RepID=UPI003A83844D